MKAIRSFIPATTLILAGALQAVGGGNIEPGDKEQVMSKDGPQGQQKILVRKEVKEEYKWRLADLFPTPEAWEKAYEKVAKAIPDLAKWEGRLTSSPQVLAEAYGFLSETSKLFARLYAYAALSSSLDTRDNEARALTERMKGLAVKFSRATSYISPELLEMEEARLREFADTKELAEYRHQLLDLIRSKEHILAKDKEAILARLGLITSAPGNIYNTFTDAEFPDPQVELVDGTKVTITKPNYVKYRADTNRENRRRVFQAFWNKYQDFRNTFAATYGARLHADHFGASVRNHRSCLAAALHDDNLPVVLYEKLIDGIHESLPAFHRYLKLRKRLLGVEKLQYHDIYAPIIKPTELDYSWKEAKQLVQEAVAPLGDEYGRTMAAGLTADGRWVDVLPTKAKRSGAFSYGVYGVHPFVLMNYIGNLNSVSTLAHELGHAMHSWLANRAQTYTNSQYKIFVAEVASTFNESLLTHMLVKQAEQDRDKLYILGEWLDNYRQTVFRQAMFAEFEWRAHQMVEEGRPVTADALNKLYLGLLRRYHGHEQGVMDIEELYAIEWAYIPHFYRNFYVFTYSTGLISSTALAEKVLTEGEPARQAYLEALAMGGSTYPLEILRHAGADLLSPEPYQVANRVFEQRLSLAEKLVGKLGL